MALRPGGQPVVVQRLLMRAAHAEDWELPFLPGDPVPQELRDVWTPLQSRLGVPHLAERDLLCIVWHDITYSSYGAAMLSSEAARWTADTKREVAPVVWNALQLYEEGTDALVARLLPRSLERLVQDALLDVANAPGMPGRTTVVAEQSSAAAYQWLLGHGIRLTEELASGAYGAVYKAVDGCNRLCAVKVITENASAELHRELATGVAVREVARRNAMFAAEALRVNSYTETLLLRAGRVATVAALVMPLAIGSLKGFRQTGPDCRARLRALADVFLGLRVLHRAGRVACDLKPDNILVFHTPQGVLACLSDFGMDRDHRRDTVTGQDALPCRGTLPYTMTRADVGKNSARPRSFARDWLVFAKTCLWFLARPGPAAAVVAGITASDGHGLIARVDHGMVPLGRRVRDNPLGFELTGQNLGLECLSDDEGRLVAWAAGFVADYAEPAAEDRDPFADTEPDGLHDAVAGAYAQPPEPAPARGHAHTRPILVLG